MKRYFFALAGVAILIIALYMPGCSTAQLQQAQADIATLKTDYTATTQAVAIAQQGLAKASADLAAASTQPSANPQVIASLQTAVTKAQSLLTAAQAQQDKVSAAIQTATNLVASMQNGTLPNVGPLSAFGQWGTLAGLLITAGAAAYQAIKNSHNMGLLGTLVAATGAPTPTAAVAQAHAAIAAAPDVTLPPPPPIETAPVAPMPGAPKPA